MHGYRTCLFLNINLPKNPSRPHPIAVTFSLAFGVTIGSPMQAGKTYRLISKLSESFKSYKN